MQSWMITGHVHIVALIASIVLITPIVGFIRRWKSLPELDDDKKNKIRLDTGTAIPIAVLLWNIAILNLSMEHMRSAKADGASKIMSTVLTLNQAVEAAGEATIALAAAISVARLLSSIWKDCFT